MVPEGLVEVQGPLHQDAVVGRVVAGSVAVGACTSIVRCLVPNALIAG